MNTPFPGRCRGLPPRRSGCEDDAGVGTDIAQTGMGARRPKFRRKGEFMKRKIILVLGLFILTLSLALPFARAGEVDEIQDAIHHKGAKWHPGETSMTQLPFH